VASNKRVSVEDAEAVYRRLRQISDLLDRLPPSAEIHEFGGATDFMITAVSQFAFELDRHASDLEVAINTLQENTRRTIADVRTAVDGIIDQDDEARAQVLKLSTENERLGTRPNSATGR
jgi:hypothetical protein